jgi:plastocyanin
MHLSNALFGLVAFTATTVVAQAGTTIHISVGAGGKLVYSPNNIVAAAGTQVEFSFNPKV